jgi:adenylate cyclase
MTRRRRSGTLGATLAIGAAASLLALAAVWSGLSAKAEGPAVDQFLAWRGERPADPRVVLCLIDEASIDAYGRWPWPRTRLRDIVDRLDAAGARVIALDIVLSEESRHGEGFDLRGEDAELAAAIDAAEADVVLSYFFRETPSALAEQAEIEKSAFDVVAGSPGDYPLPEYAGVEPNLPIFVDAASAQGFTTNERESGVSRRQRLAVRYRGRIYPALPLRAVQRMESGALRLERRATGLPQIRLGERPTEVIEVDGEGRLFVSYPGGLGSFRHVSAVDLVERRLAPDALAALDGALVFVGASEIGVGDVTATPFGFEVPGVLVHAAVADNLLGRTFLREGGAPWLLSIVVLLLIGPLVAFLVAALDSRRVAALVGVALVAAWPGIAYLVFLRLGWHLQVVAPTFAGGLALIGALGYQTVAVDAWARRIRRTFERFVSQAVVEEMLANPERVALGGERRELTVLFSDIRGFTSISERITSEELVQVLNQYFTPMTRLVLDEGGTLDKYMGDALMAFFGAPVEQPDHAARACRAALRMTDKLAELNAGWRAEDKLPEGGALGVGIGLNSGEMSVGNMGSEDVFDYTVIGDNVNLGSRIEGLNKMYAAQILVSGATAEAAGAEGFLFRELDRVRVKGKKEPVAIHELLAARPAPPELEERARCFGEALAAYRARRFGEAAEGFEALAAEGDGPAGVLAERARRLAAEGAPEGWEPVETLTSK